MTMVQAPGSPAVFKSLPVEEEEIDPDVSLTALYLSAFKSKQDADALLEAVTDPDAKRRLSCDVAKLQAKSNAICRLSSESLNLPIIDSGPSSPPGVQHKVAAASTALAAANTSGQLQPKESDVYVGRTSLAGYLEPKGEGDAAIQDAVRKVQAWDDYGAGTISFNPQVQNRPTPALQPRSLNAGGVTANIQPATATPSTLAALADQVDSLKAQVTKTKTNPTSAAAPLNIDQLRAQALALLAQPTPHMTHKEKVDELRVQAMAMLTQAAITLKSPLQSPKPNSPSLMPASPRSVARICNPDSAGSLAPAPVGLSPLSQASKEDGHAQNLEDALKALQQNLVSPHVSSGQVMLPDMLKLGSQFLSIVPPASPQIVQAIPISPSSGVTTDTKLQLAELQKQAAALMARRTSLCAAPIAPIAPRLEQSASLPSHVAGSATPSLEDLRYQAMNLLVSKQATPATPGVLAGPTVDQLRQQAMALLAAKQPTPGVATIGSRVWTHADI